MCTDITCNDCDAAHWRYWGEAVCTACIRHYIVKCTKCGVKKSLDKFYMGIVIPMDDENIKCSDCR